MPGEEGFREEGAARCSICWVGVLIRSGLLLPLRFCLFTTAQVKGLSWAVPKVSRACQPPCKSTCQHFLASKCLLGGCCRVDTAKLPPGGRKSPAGQLVQTPSSARATGWIGMGEGEQRPGCSLALTDTPSNLGLVTVAPWAPVSHL